MKRELVITLKEDGELSALTVQLDGGRAWSAGFVGGTIGEILEVVAAALKEGGVEKGWTHVGTAD